MPWEAPVTMETRPSKRFMRATPLEGVLVAEDLRLDLVLDPVGDELPGPADGVADGGRVGPAVADDADAVDAEELGAAVFGIVDLLVDLLQVPLHEEVAELGEDVLGDLVAGHGQDALDDALGDLEGDVPGEAVADDDVGDAGEQVLALDVADEAQGRLLEPVEGLLDEVVALALLLADAHQSDPGVLQADDRLHEDLAHDGELDEVVGLAVGVGPDVEEQGLPLERRGRGGPGPAGPRP